MINFQSTVTYFYSIYLESVDKKNKFIRKATKLY